jgi:hypothetical protein
MPMPTSALVRLGAFRDQLHAHFSRRADALFEVGDALLCQPTPFLSLPHLSLEPAHQRGWGSTYAALVCGRIDTERLRDLLVRFLPPAGPLVFAVGDHEMGRVLITKSAEASGGARGLVGC